MHLPEEQPVANPPNQQSIDFEQNNPVVEAIECLGSFLDALDSNVGDLQHYNPILGLGQQLEHLIQRNLRGEMTPVPIQRESGESC